MRERPTLCSQVHVWLCLGAQSRGACTGAQVLRAVMVAMHTHIRDKGRVSTSCVGVARIDVVLNRAGVTVEMPVSVWVLAHLLGHLQPQRCDPPQIVTVHAVPAAYRLHKPKILDKGASQTVFRTNKVVVPCGRRAPRAHA
eukprot:2178749-Pleurochrysis_carterae.AAC.8